MVGVENRRAGGLKLKNWYKSFRAYTEGKWYNTYTAHGIGCGVVWAVVWIVLATEASNLTRHRMFLVFLGWVIGWSTATIARAAYKRPRSD
jgi:hypothetical protein